MLLSTSLSTYGVVLLTHYIFLFWKNNEEKVHKQDNTFTVHALSDIKCFDHFMNANLYYTFKTLLLYILSTINISFEHNVQVLLDDVKHTDIRCEALDTYKWKDV